MPENRKIILPCSFDLEKEYNNFSSIAGVDEAGRGALAGPVVAAVVILDEKKTDKRINDSKKLSVNLRGELKKIIQLNALAYGVGVVEPNVIDEINILNATYKAVALALDNMPMLPDLLLTDYLKVEYESIPVVPIKKGDQKSYSIAAASILAKVTRDEIMLEKHKTFPGYSFDKNKGYPVREHYQSIKEKGVTEIHRKSFRLF